MQFSMGACTTTQRNSQRDSNRCNEEWFTPMISRQEILPDCDLNLRRSLQLRKNSHRGPMPGTAYGNGNPISNFDSRGKVLLLEFGLTYCSYPAVSHTRMERVWMFSRLHLQWDFRGRVHRGRRSLGQPDADDDKQCPKAMRVCGIAEG